MRQAIVTKYLGPTDTRGSRIKATADEGGSILLPFDSGRSDRDNHVRAALALAKRLGGQGRWVGGETRDGYAFVRVEAPMAVFEVLP